MSFNSKGMPAIKFFNTWDYVQFFSSLKPIEKERSVIIIGDKPIVNKGLKLTIKMCYSMIQTNSVQGLSKIKVAFHPC